MFARYFLPSRQTRYEQASLVNGPLDCCSCCCMTRGLARRGTETFRQPQQPRPRPFGLVVVEANHSGI